MSHYLLFQLCLWHHFCFRTFGLKLPKSAHNLIWKCILSSISSKDNHKKTVSLSRKLQFQLKASNKWPQNPSDGLYTRCRMAGNLIVDTVTERHLKPPRSPGMLSPAPIPRCSCTTQGDDVYLSPRLWTVQKTYDQSQTSSQCSRGSRKTWEDRDNFHTCICVCTSVILLIGWLSVFLW